MELVKPRCECHGLAMVHQGWRCIVRARAALIKYRKKPSAATKQQRYNRLYKLRKQRANYTEALQKLEKEIANAQS